MRYNVLLLALFLSGCATPTTPTAEETAMQNAHYAEICRQKGYKPGTGEFEGCKASESSMAHFKKQQDMAKAAGVARIIGGVLSDARLKRDVMQVGELREGIALYRFRYLWSAEWHTGVMAQEVERVVPEAVTRGRDGYLRVNYSRL